MPEPYFERLEMELAAEGVAQRYIRRLVTELEDHFEDAAAECCDADSEAFDAQWVSERLGDGTVIVAQVLARPELRGRCSGLRATIRPIVAQVARAEVFGAEAAFVGPAIARWSASITCGAFVTAALLLVMARSLALDL